MLRVVAIWALCSLLLSCNYSIVKETSTDGQVFRERFYKDPERQKRYFNSRMFKAWYNYHPYNATNSIEILNDSRIVSDSIIFKVEPSSYKGLFSEGIISGKVFDSITGNQMSLQMTDVETGEITPSQKNYFFSIWDLTLLDQFRLPKNRARLRFESNPYTYFIEIESRYSRSDTSMAEFIRNSKLVFIHKCCHKI